MIRYELPFDRMARVPLGIRGAVGVQVIDAVAITIPVDFPSVSGPGAS